MLLSAPQPLNSLGGWEGCQAGPLVLMKLTAVAIFKHNGDKEALLLGMASDLSSFGFFQRATVKEFLTFTARQVASRTQVGQRQKVRIRLLLPTCDKAARGMQGVACRAALDAASWRLLQSMSLAQSVGPFLLAAYL